MIIPINLIEVKKDSELGILVIVERRGSQQTFVMSPEEAIDLSEKLAAAVQD